MTTALIIAGLLVCGVAPLFDRIHAAGVMDPVDRRARREERRQQRANKAALARAVVRSKP